MGSKLAELKRTGSKVAAESVGCKPIGIFPGEISAANPIEFSKPMRGVKPLKDAVRIDLDRIIPDPDQPRKTFDQAELERLGESLLLHGQIHPIVVRWSEDAGCYLVYMGERRYRAAKLIGWPTIAAVILNHAEEGLGRVLERQLVENCHRADLNPIEEATAVRRLMDQSKITGEQVARLLAVSPGKISKLLALLDLPEPVQGMVESGTLAPGTAYEVSKSAEPEALATRAVEEGLTRAEVAAVVKPSPKPPETVPNTGDFYGFYPPKKTLPIYLIRAESESAAVAYAESQHPKGTKFDIIKWVGPVPLNTWIQVAPVSASTPTNEWLDETPRKPIPGQAVLPIIATSTVTNRKVETLDATKVYDLGQGVIVVIEGPREMIACPAAWLEILVKAIDEDRVDARGHVIPRAAGKAPAGTAPKKGGRR